MKNVVATGDRCVEVAVDHRDFVPDDPVASESEVRQVTVREVVERADLGSVLHQRIGEVRAEESGAPGDQDRPVGIYFV